MLARSDRDISGVIAQLAQYGIEATFIVPTETGLAKSIIDAHDAVRRYFVAKAIHDYGMQGQGPEYKVVIDVDLIHEDRFELRQMSLYRPNTKTGDPRLWIAGLQRYAQPGNLVALFVAASGRLTAVNCSNPKVWASVAEHGSPLNMSLSGSSNSPVAEELLDRLRGICRLGYVESLRAGSTGVGYTLETLLGIQANPSKSPDYKGIEIKSTRTKALGVAATRTSLFSRTPDWRNSPCGSGRALLDAFGYHDPTTGRRQLYCTVSNKPNTQGLSLRVDENSGTVQVVSVSDGLALQWSLAILEKALAEKHRETFWVKAAARKTEGTEEFRYERVVHTRRPLISNLGPLITSGHIGMDLTLSLLDNGRARDHGYLFKLWPQDVGLLFPPANEYDLLAA